MTAKFILRLDDACSTMHREKWDYLEKILDFHAVKPVVAVVPDNQDPDLVHDDVDPDFWSKVRLWKEKGWTIAMHGFQHEMHHTEAKMVLPFYNRSEFAGLSLEKQSEKIKKSWHMFQTNNVTPNVWIAPAHCFDLITLKSILAETSIKIVSDGIARNQYYEHGFFWIPQQLWTFEEKISGLWTICLHPNTMSLEDLDALDHSLGKFSSRVASIDTIQLTKRSKSLLDNFENSLFWIKRRLFSYLGTIRRKLLR